MENLIILGKAPKFLKRARIFMITAKTQRHPRTLLAFCEDNQDSKEEQSVYSVKFSSHWEDIMGADVCNWKHDNNLTLLFALFFPTDDNIVVDSPYDNLQTQLAECDLYEDTCLEIGCLCNPEFYCRIVSKHDCALSSVLESVWIRTRQV